MGLASKPTLLAALAMVLTAGPLQAQNAKSFVSITGNDANTCATDTAPCRTLTGAHNKTNAGGTVYCLDSGDFTGGTLSITKSILIDCSATGGIYRATNIAVSITAAATDVVHIRGLKIFSPADIVITLPNSGFVGSLRVEDCDLVSTASGLPAVRLGAGSANANVFEAVFVNTTISGGTSGIQIQPDGGGAKLTLDRVRLLNSGIGLDLVGTNATAAPTNLRVMVKDSTISGNTNQGVRALSTNAAGLTRVFLKDTVVVQNGTGVQANGAGAGIHVSHSTITQNGTNLSAISGGVLISLGNNEVLGAINANGTFTTTTTLR
jgi:hypothetical protein